MLVEQIFDVPGFLHYLTKVNENGDFAMFYVLAGEIVALVVLANLLVDLAMTALDPRLRR